MNTSVSQETIDAMDRLLESIEINKIPDNPKSPLFAEVSSRFSNAAWAQLITEKSITVGGCGGIGSFLVFLLSRIRPKSINVYDPDTIEAANLSGQLFGSSSIGKEKVRDINNTCMEYSQYYNINSYPKKIENISWLNINKIAICGFDNMKARKAMFSTWLKAVEYANRIEKKQYLFIDGKLAAESFEILCITGDDEWAIKKYQEEFLFNDDEAAETVCSYKQTTFMSNMIASVMVNLLVNFIANELDPVVKRDLPFYTSYDCATMYLKCSN